MLEDRSNPKCLIVAAEAAFCPVIKTTIRAHLKVCALKHALRHEPRTLAKLRDRAYRLDRSMA